MSEFTRSAKNRDEQILNLRHLIPIQLVDAISMIGEPDKTYEDAQQGMVVYYLDRNPEGVIVLDVMNGMRTTFAGMTRHQNNAKRPDGSVFNILDYMETYPESKMQRSLKNGP